MAVPSLPSTHRVWQYSSTKGGLEKNLKLNSSSPIPKPTAKEHLVKVIATALNPVDYKPASIPFVGRLIRPNLATPGIDIAGRIITPASGSSLKPGQLVFGAAGKSPIAGGGLAEYTLCKADHIIAIPEALKPIDAATIPVAGLTAYQSIVPNVKKGDRVFINGGSGGTGIFGIQIAKAVGCHVTTTCSTPNVELCRNLGADEVIDYRKQSVVEALTSREHKFDHVVDNVGIDGKLYWACPRFTRPEAHYIMVGGTISWAFAADLFKIKLWPSFLGGGERKYSGFFPSANTTDLEQIATWMREGKVKPVVDQEFEFEQVPQAIAKLRTGRARGKIVVAISS